LGGFTRFASPSSGLQIFWVADSSRVQVVACCLLLESYVSGSRLPFLTAPEFFKKFGQDTDFEMAVHHNAPLALAAIWVAFCVQNSATVQDPGGRLDCRALRFLVPPHNTTGAANRSAKLFPQNIYGVQISISRNTLTVSLYPQDRGLNVIDKIYSTAGSEISVLVTHTHRYSVYYPLLPTDN
jgi:hypothetical protein